MIKGMEPKQQPPYPLRMPPDLRAELEKMAEESKRSLNAEIVEHLQVSVMRRLSNAQESENRSQHRALSRRLFEIEAQLMAMEEIRILRAARLADAKKNNLGTGDIKAAEIDLARADQVLRKMKNEMASNMDRYTKLESQMAEAATKS